MNKTIFLMGMPGSGKSTIGKKIASKINYEFFDVDEYIEQQENHTVSEIFSMYDENYFRILESSCLKKIIEKPEKKIVSLGGGTPCFNDNISIIKKYGFSIYLEAPVQLLFDRINSSKQKRPLFERLNQQEQLNKLELLLNERKTYYEQADIKVSVISLNVNELVENIKQHFVHV